MQVWYFIIFFCSNNYWTLVLLLFLLLFFFFLCISTQYRSGWPVELCMFVGFITEADVSAGIMENFRVLLLCWFFSSLRSLVGEMMSTLGSFGSVWMKSSDATAYVWLLFSKVPKSREEVRDEFVIVLPVWVEPHFRVSALCFSVSYHRWAFRHNVVPFRI